MVYVLHAKMRGKVRNLMLTCSRTLCQQAYEVILPVKGKWQSLLQKWYWGQKTSKHYKKNHNPLIFTVKYEHFIFSVFCIQQTYLLMSSVFGKEFLYDLEKNDVKTPQIEEPSFQH